MKQFSMMVDDDSGESEDSADFDFSAISKKESSKSSKAPQAKKYRTDFSSKISTKFVDTMSVKKVFMDTDLVDPNEDLGDDFFKSPWVLPSVDTAIDYSRTQKFREGDRPYSDLSVIEDMALGAQVNLYFQLVISMSIGFIVMMVLAIPALLFSFLGEAVPLQQQDAVGLYRLTIGNIGFDKDSYSYQADAACSDEDSSRESICVDVFGQEMNLQVVALLVTIFEMLQVGVFMAVVYHIHRMYRQIVQRYKEIAYPSITEYSVYVKNISADVTEEELIQHFSKLYVLDDVDWRKRRPVLEAAPVDSTEYSGSDLTVGTWVAECIIVKKISRFLRYVRRRKVLVAKLYEARARVKMYSDRTPNKLGAHDGKLKKWDRRLLRIGLKVDSINESLQLLKDNSTKRKKRQEEARAAKIKSAEEALAEAARKATADKNAVEQAAVEAEAALKQEEADEKAAIKSVKARKRAAASEKLKAYTEAREKRRLAAAKALHGGGDGSAGKDAANEGTPGNGSQTLGGVDAEGKEELDAAMVGTAGGANAAAASGSDRDGSSSKRGGRPTQSAFVCFEYNESFARCLEDYRFFSALPMWLCFPQQLKLKGHRLQVSRAPEPDQLLWENLEVSTTRKACGRLYTLSVLVLVLLAVYALGSFAAHSRAAYEQDALVPANSGGAQLCARSLPFLYTGGEGLRKSDEVVEEYELTRAPNERRKELDAQCAEAVGDGAYFAYFTVDRLFAEPVAEFSVAACDSSYNGTLSTGLCPSYNQTVFCPCVLPSSSEECLSLGCFDDPFAGNDDKNSTALFATNSTSKGNGDDDFGNVGYGDSCVSFTAGNIGQCYCHSVIDNIIETNGVLGVLSHWASAAMGRSSSGGGDGEHPCSEAVQSYSSSTVMVFVLIMVTAALHSLLGWWVPHSVRKNEYHEYVDDVHMAVAVKVFISSYVNMSVLIVAAYGSSTESPVATEDNYVFSGAYPDFNRGWYGNVGFYLVCSFLLIVFAPIVSKYYHLACVNWRIWSISKEVDSHKLQRVSNQQQVNSFFVDGTFDAPVRTAQMLAWIFTAMTFATGLPLMMLLACIGVGFLARWDKYLVCRHHKKPTPASDKVARWALRMLPYAAALRLIVGCFMLSAADIFPHRLVPSSEAGGNSAMDTNSYRDYVSRLEGSNYFPAFLSFAEDRVFRYNTFPLFVFFVLIVLGKIIIRAWKFLPFYWFGKLLGSICSCVCSLGRFRAGGGGKGSKDAGLHPYDLTFGNSDPLRTQEAPLTGGYFKYQRHPDDRPVTCACIGGTCLQMFCCCCFDGVGASDETSDALTGGARGWEMVEMERGLHARIRSWPATVQMVDGSLKLSGDQKVTYDVIAEQGHPSYHIERIESYKRLGFELLTRKSLKIDKEAVNSTYLVWKTEQEEKRRQDEEKKRKLEERKANFVDDSPLEAYANARQLSKKDKTKAQNLNRMGKVLPEVEAGDGSDDDDDDFNYDLEDGIVQQFSHSGRRQQRQQRQRPESKCSGNGSARGGSSEDSSDDSSDDGSSDNDSDDDSSGGSGSGSSGDTSSDDSSSDSEDSDGSEESESPGK